MLGDGLLLVYRRPCLWVSGTHERWLTCSLLRVLHRCPDTIPRFLGAANHRDQNWSAQVTVCPLCKVRKEDSPQN